jgi:hypothetical protein
MNSNNKTLENKLLEHEMFHEIASLLNTGLDRRTISIILELLDNDIHPEALADSKSQY